MLDQKYDLYIATASPWGQPSAASDKIFWVQRHFGETFAKRVTITHSKHLLIGDYLIDDRKSNGAAEFRGEHIHFGQSPFSTWKEVVDYLMK